MASPVLAQAELAPGDVLGKYRIQGLIGDSGTMGRLYLAARTLDDASIAVRVLPGAVDDEALHRFVETARAAAKLHKKHVADVLDRGVLFGGRVWIANGISEGRTLQAWAAEHPLEPIELLAVLRGIARAIDLAHDRGLVHGNLETSSVCLSNDSEGQLRSRILEFGAWHLFPDRPGALKARSPQRSGTTPGASGDLRAVGMMCFEALTGQIYEEGRRVSDLRPELGPHFDDAVATILDADRRPKSGHELFERVRLAAMKAGYGDGGIPAPPNQPVDDSTQIDVLVDPRLGPSSPPGPKNDPAAVTDRAPGPSASPAAAPVSGTKERTAAQDNERAAAKVEPVASRPVELGRVDEPSDRPLAAVPTERPRWAFVAVVVLVFTVLLALVQLLGR